MGEDGKIDNEVEKTLACFHDDAPLEAGPYFTGQTLAKIRKAAKDEKGAAKKAEFLPSLRPAFVVLIVLLNLATGYFMYLRPKTTSSERDTYLSELSEDYSLSNVSQFGSMTE